MVNLLWANEMYVCINATCSCNQTCTTVYFCACTYHHIFCNTIHCIRISCFANANNFSIFYANICFHNSPMINNHYTGNYKIQNTFFTCGSSTFSHSITNGFATTKLGFIAINCIIFFNFNKQFCVA